MFTFTCCQNKGGKILTVEFSEVCRDQMRKVVGQPGDNLAGIPHPDEVSYILKLKTAVSGTAIYYAFVALKVEPFPGPIDLNVTFRVKRADEGCRVLEVATVDGSSEFVFVSELDLVHYLSYTVIHES